MGVDIHVIPCVYNCKTNLFEEVALYVPGESYHYDKEGNKIVDNPDFKKVYIYNGRNTEMFDGMKHGNETDGYGVFPYAVISLNSLEPKLREKITEYSKIEGYYDFYEINLADMKNYLNDHPTVVDYDKDWDENKPAPRKENPIKGLFEEICAYLKFACEWDWEYLPLSHFKILFFFDC